MRLSHVAWNLGGLAFPLGIAVLTVPYLIENLGQERFGLLALAWALIGYAGALDLGIGRATTQYVAKLINGSDCERNQIPIVLFTAVRITLVTSAVGVIIILILAVFDVADLIKTKTVNPVEIKYSLFLLAFALPMQAVSATFKGVNEAFLNFKGISVIRVLLGCANFEVPFIVSIYSNKVQYLVGSLVLSRFIALYFYRKLAQNSITGLLNNNYIFSSNIAKNLFRFGGWFTLSSILNPFVGNAERFIISAIISAASVSIYVIPYEMVVQSLVVVGALTTVTFPYLTQVLKRSPDKAINLFYKILLSAVIVMTIFSLAYYFFGDQILMAWLGIKYTEDYYKIAKILSFGLVPYTIGTLCISFLHAHGKTALTAYINMFEFPLFLTIIYLAISNFGITGAAYAWVIRILIDSIILLLLTMKIGHHQK
jgi:O-antigen/teichoic acid export membrane protein